MEIHWKAVSNIAAGIGALVVLISYILWLSHNVEVDMDIALKVGGFLKLVFLGVDASVLAGNVLNGKRGGYER